MAHRNVIILFAAIVAVFALTASLCAAGEGPTLTRLTTQPGIEGCPTWSANGQSIFFISDTQEGSSICRIDAAEGASVSVIRKPSSKQALDMWLDTTDDDQLVYASIRGSGNCQLFTLDPDQGKSSRIMAPSAVAQFPRWSPDGKRIAFCTSDDNGLWQVYTMAKDGTDVRKVTAGVHPAWSPDGKRIAFARETSVDNWDIYAANADGSNPVQLTSGGVNELEPDWSLDGKIIAYTSVTGPVSAFFTRDRSGTKVRPKSAIYMKSVDATGTAPVQLLKSDCQNVHPRWSPDGKKMVIVSDRNGSLDIWLMALPAAQ